MLLLKMAVPFFDDDAEAVQYPVPLHAQPQPDQHHQHPAAADEILLDVISVTPAVDEDAYEVKSFRFLCISGWTVLISVFRGTFLADYVLFVWQYYYFRQGGYVYVGVSKLVCLLAVLRPVSTKYATQRSPPISTYATQCKSRNHVLIFTQPTQRLANHITDYFVT